MSAAGVRCCVDCLEEIQVLTVGDDEWLDYCESCHQIEGKTIELTEEEYSKI